MASTPSVTLRALLECLGKSDKRRDERDQSGQELHEINQIGHGHHLPSHGGRCPAHGTAVNNSYSTKLQLKIRIYVRSRRRNDPVGEDVLDKPVPNGGTGLSLPRLLLAETASRN